MPGIVSPDISGILDLDRFPLDRPAAPGYRALVERCRAELAEHGMTNLPGFMHPAAAAATAHALGPVFEKESFRHRRRHNVYFRRQVPGLEPGHPALRELETSNRTLCADQLGDSALPRVYAYAPLVRFLAAILGKTRLHPMADSLARINVMTYEAGEALNWHFDRAEFTTTLLLQAPLGGGAFQYRTGLRSDADPNYDGVAQVLAGQDPAVQTSALTPGTLNVFRGKNTLHRVTPVEGPQPRMVAVFSYFERPGVEMSPDERAGFYGRAA